MRALADHELHERLTAFALADGVAHGGEACDVDIRGAALGGFLFRDAHRADGRIHEDRRWYVFITHAARVIAEQRIGKRVTNRGCHGGQVHPVQHIANRIDMRLAGRVVVIHRDHAIGTQAHTRLVQPKPLGRGLAPGAEKDRVENLRRSIGKMQHTLRVARFNADRADTGMAGNVLCNQGFSGGAANILIKTAQREWRAMHQRNLCAKPL